MPTGIWRIKNRQSIPERRDGKYKSPQAGSRPVELNYRKQGRVAEDEAAKRHGGGKIMLGFPEHIKEEMHEANFSALECPCKTYWVSRDEL